ncbi:MAG TPA: LacI family DNA-binding transcriptional regulator [Bacteroidales bacterium]|nr:LacI family DNA-binding transcriptional regulator [Bacteroidales bacterium]HPF02387.1 LacI family DNA-binding transcriptional regulator [Bacteroidales bacterium]HPJ58930.1 LacI family DNA-binding transcriptional regulator [Bacteroidales bacterium]HPR12184.1 LacI family DNA-binding transcriptional regulator [Bacteroidales bacterium]HRW84867.1 LacI family DNA-binding transcriptional regulator [Bacteroidales bacterium]
MKSSREVTIYDVAKALNLSPSTVSRGLKNHPHIKKETRKKIQTAAGEMGYRQNKFASNLRQKHTNTIGIVVPRLNSYFMATAIAGIEKITSENGYGLIISQSLESWRKEILSVSTMFNSRVDGLLVSLAFDTKNMDHFNIFFKKDIPVVFFDRVSICGDCTSVIIDNFRAGFEVTTHLLEQGCRRILHLGGNMQRNVYSERFRGYREALAAHRIPFLQSLVIESDMSAQAGREAAINMLRMRPVPDGIFASSDTTAVSAIVELEKAGVKIPDDIAVAGFNNEPVSQVVKPNLTTVDYPAQDIGEIAATSLIGKIKDIRQANLSTIVLKHSLVVRDSSLRKKQYV